MAHQCSAILFLIIYAFVRPGLTYDTTTLDRCPDPSKENPGYSSTVSHGRSLWTHCGFPNPKLEQTRCGRPFSRDVTYNLCDPDQVLLSEIKNQLDQSLWSLEISTPYQCTPWHGAVLNYTIILVAVRYLRIPDLSSNETCINGCGEIVPDMDEFSRSATDEEKQLAIDNFASGLLNEFGGYFCDSFLVIAYWENETLISTALTSKLSSRISANRVEVVTRRALDYLASGETFQAFDVMITEYRALILGFTPAMAMLVIHMTLLVISVILIVLYAFFGGKSDYYDEEKWKLVLKTTMKIICGVWFVEWLLIMLVRVQGRIKLWIIIFPLVGLIAAVIGAFFLYEQSQ
ncbi:hypothetical protein LSH36_986g00017 [Paralvinella palmiformis]|uniref:Uncharacterized protein n=1 Tax=Paralvinella palmiformis TaxID=53620 RepID=A0AAD9IXL0_9ANNE|nr:hypothetical protein LSH36_986g00017 [Paralvinella palmiformis]